MIASAFIVAAMAVFTPTDAGQKDDGFAKWSHPFLACEPDGQFASVVVSAEWPNFQSNRLLTSGFDPGGTSAGAELCVRVRQDTLNGDGVYDLYIVPTIMTKSGEYLTLSVEGHRIPQDEAWVDLRFTITKAVGDWSTTAVSWVVVSSLLDAAEVDVDAVWVE